MSREEKGEKKKREEKSRGIYEKIEKKMKEVEKLYCSRFCASSVWNKVSSKSSKVKYSTALLFITYTAQIINAASAAIKKN